MTEAKVRIPTPLRSFTGGADEVVCAGADVRAVLAALATRFEGIGERILDDSGELRPFVNVFVGARDVRTLEGLGTPLADGAVLSILPAVAGGRP